MIGQDSVLGLRLLDRVQTSLNHNIYEQIM
jgi:hypothetical protein